MLDWSEIIYFWEHIKIKKKLFCKQLKIKVCFNWNDKNFVRN